MQFFAILALASAVSALSVTAPVEGSSIAQSSTLAITVRPLQKSSVNLFADRLRSGQQSLLTSLHSTLSSPLQRIQEMPKH